MSLRLGPGICVCLLDFVLVETKATYECLALGHTFIVYSFLLVIHCRRFNNSQNSLSTSWSTQDQYLFAFNQKRYLGLKQVYRVPILSYEEVPRFETSVEIAEKFAVCKSHY